MEDEFPMLANARNFLFVWIMVLFDHSYPFTIMNTIFMSIHSTILNSA